MYLEEQAEARNATQRLRCPPREPILVRLTANGEGRIPDQPGQGPIELTLEVTHESGDFALWFHDDWWADLIERWGDEAVTIQIAPTPAALLHPVTLHQVEMARRVVPRWRLIGHAYLSDIAPQEIVLLARTFYDEVRVIDAPRPTSARSSTDRYDLSIEELFSQVRREQAELGTTRPILVRIPKGETAGPAAGTNASPTARTESGVPDAGCHKVTT